jgi:hypothetical protein
MANLFDPLNWNDGPSGGTPASVDRGARRWEAGIESLDVAVDAHDDRINALESALSALGITGADVMTTTERLTTTPTEGKLIVDSDLPALLIGKPGGAGWWKVDLTTLTGAGGLAGPAGTTAVVSAGGTIGQIQVDAQTVAGAAVSGGRGPYILYEDQSLSGVSGATALASPSSLRTPGSPRQYGYWFTAMVAGVETAAGARATATLPYVAPGGGGGGGGATGTPAQILNIGTGSTQNHFNVGVGYSTGHVDHTMTEIINGYTESPYFQPNAAGDAVRMKVFANGKTTSNKTGHPRVELRELLPDDAHKAAWDMGNGTHIMSGTSKVTHLPADAESAGQPKPWTCFAQIHDALGDVVRLQVEDTASTPAQSGGVHSVNNLRLVAHTHEPNGADTVPEGKWEIQSSYTIGSDINWKIEVINGTCKIYIGGVVKKTISISTVGGYFKAGTYAQFSTVSGDGQYASTSYAETEVRNLVVTHS